MVRIEHLGDLLENFKGWEYLGQVLIMWAMVKLTGSQNYSMSLGRLNSRLVALPELPQIKLVSHMIVTHLDQYD